VHIYKGVYFVGCIARTSVNTTINGFEEFPFSAFFFMVLLWVDLCAHASQIDELPLKDDQIKSEAKQKGPKPRSHKFCDKL